MSKNTKNHVHSITFCNFGTSIFNLSAMAFILGWSETFAAAGFLAKLILLRVALRFIIDLLFKIEPKAR